MSLRKFEAYQRSIEFFALSIQIVEQLPSGTAQLKDQLKRAALSTVLNTAEGAGKFSAGDKRRYYGIARGSAMECQAIVDVCTLMSTIDSQLAKRSEEAIERIIAILTKLCLRTDTRSRERLRSGSR